MLKNANPTDKKGNSNQSEKRKYLKQAEKLFNLMTTGKDFKEFQAVKMTAEQEQQVLDDMVQGLPKYQKPG